MYLDGIALTQTLPCMAEPDKIIVIGKPNRPLHEAIPYLGTLPGVIAFNPETCVVTFRRPSGFLTVYPDRVYITKVKDANEGIELLAAFADAINAIWEHRADLLPADTVRRAPRPLDIWSQLPQTNCKQCGEETCLAFACNILLQKRTLSDCIPLQTDATFGDRRAALEGML